MKGVWHRPLIFATDDLCVLTAQGYFVLRGNDMSPMAYALMFGLVGGIMVWISVSGWPWV